MSALFPMKFKRTISDRLSGEQLRQDSIEVRDHAHLVEIAKMAIYRAEGGGRWVCDAGMTVAEIELETDDPRIRYEAECILGRKR